MKANQKFLRGSDDAVSPVIAVILMVAITVVLAATVYVWVSGFGSGGGNTPAHTMALTSGGAIGGVDTTEPADGANEYYYKPYTVASADPSLTYGDLKVTLSGSEIAFDAADADLNDCENAAELAIAAAPAAGSPEWSACGGATERAADDLVQAGDKVYILVEATDDLSGEELIFLDRQANSVMLTLTVR